MPCLRRLRLLRLLEQLLYLAFTLLPFHASSLWSYIIAFTFMPFKVNISLPFTLSHHSGLPYLRLLMLFRQLLHLTFLIMLHFYLSLLPHLPFHLINLSLNFLLYLLLMLLF